MNMKDTVILLIFLLSILGLIMGIHYTESEDIEKTPESSQEMVSEDSNGTITITSEKAEGYLNNLFT